MNSNRFRRAIVASLILGLGTVMACSRPESEVQGPVVTVYATPT